MRRILLAVLASAGALLLLVGTVWWLNVRGEESMADLPVAAVSPGDIARGSYLARAGNCMACHTERGGTPYAGGRPIDTPFGTLYAGNLTPDATGLKDWSPGHFWRALHHGRSRDGRLLYPAFPYPNYTRVTRSDSDALFAYLRSLPPAKRSNTPHALRWPYSTQPALAVWRALYFSPGIHAEVVGQSAAWNRGAYLVQGLGHCSACHTARNALGASANVMDLSGGMIPMQNWYAPSLASPQEAGVSAWRVEDIARLLQTGVAPGATVLGPMAEVVMHSTQHLSGEDLRAMAVYLKELPQAPAQLAATAPPAAAEVAERGLKIYGQHCAQCHGEQGLGIAGAYPRLAANRAVTLASPANLVQVVLAGGFAPATAGNPRPFGMPPYATVLGDADVAAVLTYIRSSWGNNASPVSELTIALQRGSTPP